MQFPISQNYRKNNITMNLKEDKHLPFRKENPKNIYMNFNFNHPYLIKREIPAMIQKIISSLFKNEVTFKKNPL